MTEPVVRITLLDQSLGDRVTVAVQVRRITLQPNVPGGPHRHDGPVSAAVDAGSVFMQVDGGLETVLRTGDVFYEPADLLIDRFDATSEGVTFSPDESPELVRGPQNVGPPVRPRKMTDSRDTTPKCELGAPS